MGGNVKVTIIKPDGSIINGLTYTGALNNCFFSQDFCNGNIDKALYDFEEELDIKNNIVSPYGYGLILVDFPRQMIHSMQNYDHPYSTGLASYDREIKNIYIGERDFKNLTEHNLIKIRDESNELSFSLQDFFNTLDIKEIHHILRDKNVQNTCGGKAENYLSITDEDLYVQPSIIDFHIKRYDDSEITSFLEYLIGNKFIFNEEEQKNWLSYVKKNSLDIKEYMQQIFCKMNLNIQLNNDLENDNKNITLKHKI